MDSWRYSLDLPRVSLISQSRSRDLDRLFFRLLLVTFSKIASRDLERYLFLSVSLSLQVWQDLLDDPEGEWTLSLCEGEGELTKWSGAGIFSISGEGEGGSESLAIQGCCRHCSTVGRHLKILNYID